MSNYTKIAEIEKQILKMENNPNNVIGGLKSWNSGYEIEYKPAIAKKLQKLNKELDKLLDLCEEV